MSKFKNRLASIVLSTITLAGGVTTCLISDSAVYQCQAIITDEKMKELINEALEASFQQNDLLTQITADNLTEVLQRALDKIFHDNNDTPLTEKERNDLQTLVNTFLYCLSCCLVDHLLSSLPGRTYRTSVLTETEHRILQSYSPGPGISEGFTVTFTQLLEKNVPTHENYFPRDFLALWWSSSSLLRPADALQSLLQ